MNIDGAGKGVHRGKQVLSLMKMVLVWAVDTGGAQVSLSLQVSSDPSKAETKN